MEGKASGITGHASRSVEVLSLNTACLASAGAVSEIGLGDPRDVGVTRKTGGSRGAGSAGQSAVGGKGVGERGI